MHYILSDVVSIFYDTSNGCGTAACAAADSLAIVVSDGSLKVFSIVISLVSLATSIAAAIFSHRVNRRLKALDVVVKCQERYDRIAFDAKHAVKTRDEALDYYVRFWSLQWDQFEFWEDGVIGKERYGFWMSCRNQEWGMNESVVGVSYRDGWAWAVDHQGWRGNGFYTHMQKVFAVSPILPPAGGKTSVPVPISPPPGTNPGT